MPITLRAALPHKVAADWLLVGVWENEPLAGIAAKLDAKAKGLLARLLERGDLAGKAKELTPLYDADGLAAPRLLVVGLGARGKADFAGVVDAFAAASKELTTKHYRRVAAVLPEHVPGLDDAAVVRAVGLGLAQGCQGPGLHKTKADRFAPDEFVLVTPPGSDLGDAVEFADREARAITLARELVNRPPSDLDPAVFARRCEQVAAAAGLEIEVLDDKQIAAEGMALIGAVARGSDKPPRLVVLRHKGGGDGTTLGLVGKGVTFDSGGLSLKTTEQMVDMKCDMAGAAAVLGAMQVIGEARLPVNVLGVLPLVENMPGGRAMKLGDVIKARNGKTVEVLNTDAEGRLILADALAYAVDQGAGHLVDLATLTGACMVALGSDVAGLMGNNLPWTARVRAAAEAVGEHAWPLPMFPLYGDMVKSKVADLRNTGGSRYAGAITAAKFLEAFVGDTPWAHLDIAGPAWADHDSATARPGGTGCFVRTLVELARRY